jgi:hypothetical protein
MIKEGNESTVAVSFWKKLHKREPQSAIVKQVFMGLSQETTNLYLVHIADQGKFSNVMILERRGKARRIFLEQD